MKSLISATLAVSLLALATAQPHGHRHRHARNAAVTDAVTDSVTVTAPEVIVWVNDIGSTISIETKTPVVAAGTSAPSPSQAAPESPTALASPILSVGPGTSAEALYQASPVSPAPATSPEAAATSQASPTTSEPHFASSVTPLPDAPTSGARIAAPATTSSSPSAAESANTNVLFTSTPPSAAPELSASPVAAEAAHGSGFGITWDPYTADSGCKPQDQVNSELATISGYSIIRVYGTDCNMVGSAVAAAQQYGMKVFAGVTGLDNLADNLASIIAQASSNLHVIDTINIGNELINSNLASVESVVAALGTARGILGAAGFSGSIVTVDTFDKVLANPQLCQAGDYCAANCHAYFDTQMTSVDAGDYVSRQRANIAEANPGKRVVITESGWPYAGTANGAAVASVGDQHAAIASLRSAFAIEASDLFLFDSFDCPWKSAGIEQHFGIYGH